MKFSQITYFSEDKGILYLVVRVLYSNVLENATFAFVQIFHLFKDDLYCYCIPARDMHTCTGPSLHTVRYKCNLYIYLKFQFMII